MVPKINGPGEGLELMIWKINGRGGRSPGSRRTACTMPRSRTTAVWKGSKIHESPSTPLVTEILGCLLSFGPARSRLGTLDRMPSLAVPR